MQGAVRRDFEWQRRFIPEVKRILGEHLIEEAPFEEDAKRNTDLLVLAAQQVRIACRIRTHGYVLRYPYEVTIRTSRPGGAETELAKVLSGWGHFMFYGFADPAGKRLCAWVLGDLNRFRLWHHRQLRQHRGQLPGQAQSNGDGSSDFRAYRVADLPPEFVIARRMFEP